MFDSGLQPEDVPELWFPEPDHTLDSFSTDEPDDEELSPPPLHHVIDIVDDELPVADHSPEPSGWFARFFASF